MTIEKSEDHVFYRCTFELTRSLAAYQQLQQEKKSRKKEGKAEGDEDQNEEGMSGDEEEAPSSSPKRKMATLELADEESKRLKTDADADNGLEASSETAAEDTALDRAEDTSWEASTQLTQNKKDDEQIDVQSGGNEIKCLVLCWLITSALKSSIHTTRFFFFFLGFNTR